MNDFEDLDFLSGATTPTANAKPIVPVDLDGDAISMDDVAATDVQVAQTTIPTQTLTVNLPKDKFTVYMNVLQMLKESCSNMFVKDGMIRQLNDNGSAFIEMDTTVLLTNANMILNNLVGKYDALGIYKKQGVDMNLDITPNYYAFRDSKTKYSFPRPIENVIDRRYIELDRMDGTLKVNKGKRILSCKMTKNTLDMIPHWSKQLSATVLNFEFNGDSAKCLIKSAENSSTHNAIIATFDDELDDTNLNSVGFSFPTSAFLTFLQGGLVEINAEIYHRDDAKSSCVLILSGDLDIPETDLKIRCRVCSIAWLTDLNSAEIIS